MTTSYNTNDPTKWASYKNAPKDLRSAYNTCIKKRSAGSCAEKHLVEPGKPYAGSVDSPCTEIMTNALFVQIFVSAELLIFPVRALSWSFLSAATPSLYVSVFGALILFTVLSAQGVPQIFFAQALGWENAAIAWAWAVGGTILLDVVKIFMVQALEGSADEIPEEEERVPDPQDTSESKRALTRKVLSERSVHRGPEGKQRPTTTVNGREFVIN